MARNNAQASASASGGTGFAGLLTIAFIVLKLTHVVTWSWWWVVSPLWISAGAALAVIVLVVLVIAAVALVRRGAR